MMKDNEREWVRETWEMKLENETFVYVLLINGLVNLHFTLKTVALHISEPTYAIFAIAQYGI